MFHCGMIGYLPVRHCVHFGVCCTYLEYEHCNRYQLGQLGVRIVQLSDIHISPTMTESHLEQLIERVNALESDVLLATGDFVMPFSEDNHDHLYLHLQRSTAPVFMLEITIYLFETK